MSCIGLAQSGASSSLNGTVADQSGGVIPGAEVTVKNDATGAVATAITAENGTFSIPSLTAGTYTATVDVPNFKQSVIKNIVLLVGVPANVRIVLQVGGSTETVTVVAGAEVVQSSTATISTTMSTSQIAQLPLPTRNALDFLVYLPGANTTGSARDTLFMGLPDAAINITVDGINTQDQYLKSSDGFYTLVTARPDAIQEVTVSTAAAGAESAGAGAVQIKFITRSGTNDYNGSLYWYHRNPWLNSNYWFYNRDAAPVYQGGGPGKGQPCTPEQMANEFDNCKAPRNRVLLNQAGGRLGGPITIPGLFSGKDRAFFFLNLETYRMPDGRIRTNTIYAPAVEAGNYVYLYKKSGQPDQVLATNLLTLAQSKGYTSTMDPTVQKLLADIRSSTEGAGAIKSYPEVSNPMYQEFTWASKGMETRNYITTRFDFNVTSRHRVEGSFNGETRRRDPDYLNSQGWRYPGFPGYGFSTQNRGSVSFALRSTITPRIVNEARGGALFGNVLFYPNINNAIFTGGTEGLGNLDGFAWTPSGITGVYTTSSPSRRSSPVKSFEDTLTLTRGSHSMSFGVQFNHIHSWLWSQTVAPSIGFGLPSAYDPAYSMFDSTNGSKNFPNATSSQISSAASLYASLTARVTNIGGSGIINEITDEYSYNGPFIRRAIQRELGFFAQDSWRMKPGLTLTYGLRWEFSLPWKPLNNAYSWATPAEGWGLSGVNSLFKPGATGGVPTKVFKYNPGDPAYDTDYKAFAPSFGFAWSPGVKDGFLGKILGGGSQTVLRGGFSIAYNRYGMANFNSMFASNPGGSITASRSQDLGNLILPGESWPLLFREKNRLGPPDFAKKPVFPLTPSINDSINAFEPDIRTPYTMSWTFGIQREITKEMAIEVRYAATRNLQAWYQRDLNERNIVENGWLDEFWLAQENLYANLAAGRGKNFRYYGPNTGTYPLPITLAYLSGGLDPNDPANYTTSKLGSSQGGFFTNTTYNNNLNTYNPAPSSLAGSLYGDATRRTNALSAGLPANFFIVNPAVQNGGAWIYKNGGGNMYDSMVVELRRRMAKGLLVQGSYVWAKAFNLNVISYRAPWVKDLGATLPHAFKINWVYEMPFGRGRSLFSGVGTVVDRIIGGWEMQGASRIQSGNQMDFGNVNLVGMTDEELRNAVGLWFDDAKRIAYYVPKDFIDETYKAHSYDAGGFTSGAPTGRYVAPAGSAGVGNCVQIVSGDCAPRHHYVRGPQFTRIDLSLVKRIRITERKNFELRAEFLNAFNYINFYGNTCASNSLTCGQVGSAYRDESNQQDPGGRLVQIVLRINF